MAGEVSRFRTLSKPWQFFTRVLFVGLPIVAVFFIADVPYYLGLAILREQYYGIFLAMVLGCVFIAVPPSKGAARDRVPWYDILFSFLSFCVGLYLVLFYPDILLKLDLITPTRLAMSAITIVLILEGVRRLTGWVLLGLGLFFILYARFAWLVPGMFGGPGMPWDRLLNYLFVDTNALLGIPMMVATVIVLPLILFGNVLFGVGGGTFLTDFTMSTFGRFRGGSAKISVVASSMFGTVSGSAVANVATTGIMTIPMMKRAGYPPHIAGAVEAVASNGGQLVPPIMGAAIFIMAEFTSIPYREIAIAALIPAFLYYLCVFVQVDLEAAKTGLKGVPRDQLPQLRKVLRQCYLIVVPLAVLVFALFILWYTPAKSALLAVLSVLILSLVQHATRLRVAWLLEALEKTGRAMLELSLIVALASLVIGVINATGLGFVLSLFLGQLAGENIFLLLFIIAGTSILLGMGLPTTCLYIVLAVLMAPSLTDAGIGTMAAHLFILYFGLMSMTTPPICLAAYAAAAIADSDPMRTGFAAMRLGITAYVIPFIFAFFPALLFEGPPLEIIVALITAMLGCFLLASAVTGYLFRELGLLMRVMMSLAGIILMIPVQQGNLFTFGLLGNIVGGVIALLLLLREWYGKKTMEDYATYKEVS